MSFLFEISIILLIAALLGMIAKTLKQPLILAYIITGILASGAVFDLIKSPETIAIFSDFGIAFLLFMVGLNMNMRMLKDVGRISIITGVGQVIFTSLIGYVIGMALGFSPMQAIYISIALTFSSTIIIVKLLMDKNEIDTLYGRISIGFLLAQDFIAIGILLVLTNINMNIPIYDAIFISMLKGSLLFAIVFFFNRFVFPRVFEKIARSQELLFLSGIAWCFSLASLSNYLGFSTEIGAFLAGLSLATIPYHYEIGNKIKPLRDFFLVLFFVVLGSSMTISHVSSVLLPAIIFSLFVLIGNPLIVMILMGVFGSKKRTGFMAGLTVAQISEFSLILVALGVKLGHIDMATASLVTIVGIITITASSYMIMHNDRLYHKISKHLTIFERKGASKENSEHSHENRYDAILIGCHRMGHNILNELKKKKIKTLVLDFNPDVMKRVTRENVPFLYGDVSDPDIIDKIREYWPKIVISTIPDFEENIILIGKIKEHDRKAAVIATSYSLHDAMEMYDAGADYVIMPHFLGGEKVVRLLDRMKRIDLKKLSEHRNEHIKELKRQKEIM